MSLDKEIDRKVLDTSHIKYDGPIMIISSPIKLGAVYWSKKQFENYRKNVLNTPLP